MREAAQKFGSQCVVVARSMRNAADPPGHQPLKRSVFTHGGRRDTGIDAVEWCRRVVELGAGEILLTSMDRDGTGQGFDLELLRAVCGAVRVPVIASGRRRHRCNTLSMARAPALPDCWRPSAVFHFGTFTIAQAKAALHDAGLPVRLPRARLAASGLMGKSAKQRTGKKAVRKREGGRQAQGASPEVAASVLDRIWAVVTGEPPQCYSPEVSHSARLLSRGTAKIAQKFGEEAIECLIEATAIRN